MSLLTMMLSATLSTASTASGACVERLCQSDLLAPVAQKVSSAQPVHIMMIGDSLTAGDALSHGWRQSMDSVYGSAGRGVVDGARPYSGYLTWGIDAQSSGGWRFNGIFGKHWRGVGSAAVGLSGYAKTTTGAGEWMTLEAEDARYSFDRFVLCGQAGPYAGSVTVSMGYQNSIIPFYSETAGPMCREVRSNQPVTSVMVRTLEEKLITINSMGTFRSNGGGVTVTNLGVPGSQLTHANRKNAATVFAELQAYKPDMVVVAFGTNEGFNSTLKAGSYEANLRRHIRDLQLQTPANVPIMLIGPPNAMTRNSKIAYAGEVSPIGCETGLMVPGNIRHVNAIQRRVAQDMGLVFWDWGMAMGGPCAMYQWRAAGLAARDAIHFKKEGGARLGAILASDLGQVFRRAMATAQAAPGQATNGYPVNNTGVQIIR